MSVDLEALLREALAPVEPPASVAREWETTLSTWTELAQEELEGWELQAMRDPRNWVRPVAAAVVTATAGTAARRLLRVRARQRARVEESNATCASSPSARFRTSQRKPGASCRIDSFGFELAVCYRHPSRETGVSCSSCGRPICPDCMTPTSVGMRCPECARERTKARSLPRRAPGQTMSWSSPIREWSVTQYLITINVIIFVAEVATGVPLLSGRYGGWVWSNGVLYGPALTHGNHQYWRLLSSGFLHASLIHIALNMLSLWFIGRMLEPAIGGLNFFAIYMASLLAGSFGALLFEPGVPTLGASTAIFGVFGALIVVAHARRISIWQSGLGPMLPDQPGVHADDLGHLDRRAPWGTGRRIHHGRARGRARGASQPPVGGAGRLPRGRGRERDLGAFGGRWYGVDSERLHDLRARASAAAPALVRRSGRSKEIDRGGRRAPEWRPTTDNGSSGVSARPLPASRGPSRAASDRTGFAGQRTLLANGRTPQQHIIGNSARFHGDLRTLSGRTSANRQLGRRGWGVVDLWWSSQTGPVSEPR